MTDKTPWRCALGSAQSTATGQPKGIALVTIAVLAIIGIGGCASPPPPHVFCESDTVLLDQNFPAGAFDDCRVTGSNSFHVTIAPEDPPPINPSPWYAVRLTATRPAEATLTFSFLHSGARYWPKISGDGVDWTPLPLERVVISDDGETATVTVQVPPQGLYLAGQELLTGDWYDGWLRELHSHPEVSVARIGTSLAGRPVQAANAGDSRELVLLLGRQHPPEIPGALSMRTFVSVLLGDTELARAFRERYRLVIVPLLNPDGVAAGHWRHNLGGVDLNRDWGPFSQPETRAVRELLSRLARTEAVQPVLMLDFHGTRRNLLYTQTPEDFSDGIDFAGEWHARAQSRFPGSGFTREARPTSEQPNAKNYFFKTYGIPSITFELGDETDREVIERASRIYAEEMMTLLTEPVLSQSVPTNPRRAEVSRDVEVAAN